MQILCTIFINSEIKFACQNLHLSLFVSLYAFLSLLASLSMASDISEQVSCKPLTNTLLFFIESHGNKALGKAWKSLDGAAGSRGGGRWVNMGGQRSFP